MKTCTKCHCRLPLRKFQSRRGSGDLQAVCTPCLSAARRLRDPLPALPRNPLQVRLNNHVNLWFGPVRREPFRSHA